MTYELLSAIASVGTFLVIAATAIAAIMQLRHLRAGNQSSALLSIEEMFDESHNIGARDIVRHELPAALADSNFRAYLLDYPSGNHRKEVPPEFVRLRRAAALVANSYETFGALVKHRVVVEGPFIDIYGPTVGMNWRLLEVFIAITREGAGTDTVWENFEYLAARNQIWEKRISSWYPKGTPRLTPRDPWSSGVKPGTPPPSQHDGD